MSDTPVYPSMIIGFSFRFYLTWAESAYEFFWLRGHKNETVSLLISVSLFLYTFLYIKLSVVRPLYKS